MGSIPGLVGMVQVDGAIYVAGYIEWRERRQGELALGGHRVARACGSGWCVGSLSVAEHHAAIATFLSLKLGPLVGGEDGADAEEHLGVSLL